MTKELRRLSIIVLAMFLALFAATSWTQVLGAQALTANPENRRTLFDSYQIQRGSIVASGVSIATAVPAQDEFSWQREYLDSEMWAPVTGWVNPALGRATGLELAMNSSLSGTSGSQFFDRVERIISGLPPRGSSVEISVDAAVQRAAYDALAGYQGAVVAIEPATGRILAMANRPSYDTNAFAVHDPAAVEQTQQRLEADPAHPLDNRAIAGDLNPPGSTFKLVVASAALASGNYTPESTLPNPATYTLPQSSHTIRNASGGTCGPGETVTVADALRLSCNIPFAELAVALGDRAIREEAEKYGFNSSFELPLVSTPSQYPQVLDDAQTALSGFGQFDVTATPLQIAMVSAGIANGGMVMTPRMVDTVIGPDLAVQQTFDNVPYGQALQPDLAAQMVQMMVANVSNGAASGARIDGVEVAGKTGTAENGDDPYTLWYTGFAPADNPEVAVAVVIEDGGGRGKSGSGNQITAPIAKKVMEAVLNQ